MSSPSEFARDFGALIQKHIDRLGWTHEAVAVAVWGAKGADRKGHVSGYINARRGKPSAATIRGFADALSIPDAEIEALRTREREAAQAEALALNIPLGFLDAMADLFGDSESFGGWETYADFMQAKAQDYARLQSELEDLRQQQPNTANRIPQIEALLADGKIEQAETALEALRDTATDKALEGISDLSRIMSLQADAALLRGDQDEAFDLWRDAAALFDTLAPLEGAALRNRWEDRLYQYARRMGGNGFQHSATLLALNLRIYTKQDHPQDWAKTQNSLAIALQEQGTRTEGQAGADLLARAVDAYTAALEVYTQQNHAVNWAGTQNNLGIALQEQGTRTEGQAGADLLARAVAAYTAALEVYTRQVHPVNWATTQNNLGVALKEQGSRTEGQVGAHLLDRAVAAYTAALEVHTRQDLPVWWAETQENLAIVYLAIADRDAGVARAAHLTEALTAADNALEVYDPETMSYRHGIATRLRERILAEMESR